MSKLLKTRSLFYFLMLIISSVFIFSSCTKNVLAGKASQIDKGHLITAPVTFNLISVAAGVASATVNFPQVLNATNYEIYYKNTASLIWLQASSVTASPGLVTGLTNGINYDFKVSATNIAGFAESNILQAMPNSLPDPFTMTTLTAGDAQLFVTWPITTGIGPITYTVRYGILPGVYTNTVSTTATSPLTISGLTNGVQYYVRVFAVNYIGETASLNEFFAIPSDLPDVPTAINLAGSIGTTCSLNWTASAGLPPIVYSVKQAFAPTSAATAGTLVGSCNLITATSCSILGLTAGVSYNFSVSASNGAGSSPDSADINCNPVSNSFSLTSVAATSGNSVDVVYPSVAGATTYTTRYALTAGGAATGAVGCSAIAGTTCSITGLTQNTTYYFITTANSSSSSIQAAAELSVLTPNPATMPISFTSAGSTGTTCLFNWLASSGTPTINYTIKRSTTAGAADSSGTAVAGCTAISGATTCSDTSLVPGTTYYYSLRATNGGGTSAATTEASCRGIQNPFSITSVTQSNSRLTLVWPTVTGATSYRVSYGFATGSYPTTASTNATSPYQLNGLANGTTYYVMVEAVNATSTQFASAEGIGTPFNSPPVANAISPPSFSEDTTSTITLSYTDIESNNPSSCSLSGLTNTVLVTPCACAAGICTVDVRGSSDYNGSASFNYTVTDIGGVSNSAAATLSITAVNDNPVIAAISAQSTPEDSAAIVNFNLTDVDSILLCSIANVTATSSNIALVPNSSIVIGGTIPNCTATITPGLDQIGTSNITLTANDNGAPNGQSIQAFLLTVTNVNDPPTVSLISPQTTSEGVTSSAIAFTINDVDSVLTCVGSVTATSANISLIANSGLVIGGTAPNCTITITPVAFQNGGPILISLSVTDTVSAPAIRNFNMSVTIYDDPPTVSVIANQTINEDTPTGPLAFTINDVDSTLNCATSITATSSNTAIIANSGISTFGGAPNCTVIVTPLANQNGGPVAITLGVSDGTTTTNIVFNVTVRSILDITSVTLPANAVYVQNENLDFTVNFESSVNVTGTPRLALVLGAAARTANYVSGSGTAALLFRYTTVNTSTTDDYDGDGITFSSTNLNMAGATIIDSVSLLPVTVAFIPGVTTGILVDARTYSYSIAVSATHVNENAAAVTATLTMTQAPLIALTFPLEITGTATLGSDFTTTLGGTLTVLAGSTTATGTIGLIDDAVQENSENIILNISEPSTRSQYLGAVTVASLNINASDAPNFPTVVGQTGFATCAINQLNKLFCTGANTFGSLGVGDLNFRTSFTAVDPGTNYSVVSQGAAGSSGYSQCAITVSGDLKCWGYNNFGGVGDGTTTDRTSPVIVDSGVSYSKISVGYHGACGITTAGDLKCWGLNSNSQIGDGTTTNRLSPVNVDFGTTYSNVTRGINNTCAITTAGALKCWGDATLGTVGNGTTSPNVLLPTVIDGGTNYSSLTNSAAYTMCGITNAGVLKCWGLGTSGQIGNGATSTRLVPTVADSPTNYLRVSNSTNTTCGITTASALKCWGTDRNYNIGLSVNAVFASAQTLHSGEAFTQVILNDSRLCALNNLNVMKCSGQRQMGQTADGLLSQFHTFTAVTGLDTYTSLSLNGQFITAGLKSDGTFWTWGFGRSSSDYFGDFSVQDTALTPIQILIPTGSTFTKISKGFKHTCGIRSDQKLYCWGFNTNGNVGDNTTINRSSPVAVDAINNYIHISAGTFFTCGIISVSGALRCWGNNVSGSLGDNTVLQKNIPTSVDGGTNYKYLAVAAGSTMCGITTTDVLKCWGLNTFGQVGVGGTTNTIVPTIVDPGIAYKSVTAGLNHTCAVTTTDILKCWGLNSNFQLGDATNVVRQLPVIFNPGTNYSSVAINSLGLTCGITTVGGALKCAGARFAGLAGTASQDGFGQSSNATLVDVGTTYTELFSGYNTICGRTSLGLTKCAGDGVYGAFLGSTVLPFTTGLQFGTGAAASSLTPIGALP